jgi:hypothetical protein
VLAIAAGFAAEPASLVNEAFSVMAVELPRILVDQARIRVAQKREGSQRRVPMSGRFARTWLYDRLHSGIG